MPPVALCNDLSGLGNYTIVADVGHLPTGAARYTGALVMQVDTQQVKLWDGTGWVIMSEPSQAWTPAWHAGVTVGNGTWQNASYHRSDGYCDFQGTFVMGTTTVVTGQYQLNLPVAAFETSAGQIWAEAGLSGTFYMLWAGLIGTTFVAFNALVIGTYVSDVGTSASIPHATAAGDAFRVAGRYRMSTRYL